MILNSLLLITILLEFIHANENNSLIINKLSPIIGIKKLSNCAAKLDDGSVIDLSI